MGDLTIKEARFVEEYFSTGSAAEAYRRAYRPSESSLNCRQRAHELIKTPDISAAIEQRLADKREANKVTLERMVEFHMGILTFNPDEITRNRRGACRHCHGDNFLRQWREPEYIEALATAERMKDPLPDYAGGFGYSIKRDPHPDCPMCDGDGVSDFWIADTSKLSETARAGYHGLQQTKDGLKVIMPDRQKAADALARLMGLDKTDVRVSGDVALLAAAVNMETTDPVEASRIYQRIMTNSLAPG